MLAQLVDVVPGGLFLLVLFVCPVLPVVSAFFALLFGKHRKRVLLLTLAYYGALALTYLPFVLIPLTLNSGQPGMEGAFWIGAMIAGSGPFAAVIIAFAGAPPYKRKMSLCIRCGYSLTGNTSGTCPECGTAIRSAPPAA